MDNETLDLRTDAQDDTSDFVSTDRDRPSRFKRYLNRAAANVLVTLFALGLLGVLLLLSAAGDEAAHRRVDHVLRQLRDAALVAELEVLDARSGNVDNGAALGQVVESLKRGVDQLTHDLTPLYPPSDSLSGQLTPQVVRWFNAIESNPDESADAAAVWRESAALDQATRWFIERLDSFRNQHADHLAALTKLGDGSRALVNDLRSRGQIDLADTLFAAAEQAQDGVRRGGAVDFDRVISIANRIETQSGLKSNTDLERVAEMSTQMRRLVTAKRLAEQDATEIVSGRFKTGISELRELVTRDHLYRLATVNDARVLLNIYTVMLLARARLLRLPSAAQPQGAQCLARRSRDGEASLEVRVQDALDWKAPTATCTESQVQLVQAEKMSSLGQLVAGIMHEINTPLLYVINNAEVTAQNVDDLRIGGAAPPTRRCCARSTRKKADAQSSARRSLKDGRSERGRRNDRRDRLA